VGRSKAGDLFRKAAQEIAAAQAEGADAIRREGLKIAKREAPVASGELRDELHIDGQRIVSDTGHSQKAEFILKPFMRPAAIEMERRSEDVVGGKILSKVNELDIE